MPCWSRVTRSAGDWFQAGAVAGGADEDVGGAAGAVGEPGVGAVETFDGGFHGDPPGLECVGEAVVNGDGDAVGGLAGERAEPGAWVAEPGQVTEREPLDGAGGGVLPADRQVPGGQADRVQRDAGQPQRGDVHARARRQPQFPGVAAGEVAKQVNAGVARAHHQHVPARHVGNVAELAGVDDGPAEGGQPGPGGHDRHHVRAGGDHRMHRRNVPIAGRQLPAALDLVGAADPRAQPQPHSRRVVLQVGHVVVAGGERPAAARDPRTRLMGEHPVRVQPEMIMALPPRRSHRIGPLHHQRINPRPAERPRRGQPGRSRPHHHHKLVHRASVDPHPATVKSTAGGRSRSLAAASWPRWPVRRTGRGPNRGPCHRRDGHPAHVLCPLS